MLEEKDLQAIAQLIRSETEPVKRELDKINSRLERLEEHAEVTREATNKLLEWADASSNTFELPLPKVQ